MQQPPLIAVVDDNASVREGLDNLVRAFGFQTRMFGSAEAYLTFQGAQTVDCLICDVEMPGMGGLELQHTLTERGDRTPVILITALISAEIRARAVAAGAVACLHKPFDEDILLETLTAALAPQR